MKNCIFLVADKDMECSIKGILTRDKAIGMSQISYDINVHPQHDPGCRTSGTALLRNFSNQYEQCFNYLAYAILKQLKLGNSTIQVRILF